MWIDKVHSTTNIFFKYTIVICIFFRYKPNLYLGFKMVGANNYIELDYIIDDLKRSMITGNQNHHLHSNHGHWKQLVHALKWEVIWDHAWNRCWWSSAMLFYNGRWWNLRLHKSRVLRATSQEKSESPHSPYGNHCEVRTKWFTLGDPKIHSHIGKKLAGLEEMAHTVSVNRFIYLLLLLLFAPNVKGKWVDSNFQIIDLLVPPRAAGVAGTLIFVHIANFATLQPWLHVGSFTCRILITVYAQGTRTLMRPSATQSYVIKLSCSRKVLAASGDWTRHLWVTTTTVWVSHVSHCASKTHSYTHFIYLNSTASVIWRAVHHGTTQSGNFPQKKGKGMKGTCTRGSQILNTYVDRYCWKPLVG